MKTTQLQVKIRDVFDGYQDMDWDGVVGYGGKLDIRPAFQREYIYDIPDAQKVIRTVLKKHPLNVMYWVKSSDNNFELLDGQQRTLSICKFLDSKYYIIDENGNKQYAHSIGEDKLNKILDYELLVWVCEGGTEEVLDWFKTINIKGKELNDQESLNAVYTGPWLTDAKRHFSKPNCPAYGLGKDYLNGEVTRQEYLETVLSWISNGDIKAYMAKHRIDDDASELWSYFESVIGWVRKNFINYRNEMKKVSWGTLYNDFKDADLDPEKLESEIKELMQDEDVTKKSGIYPYVLTRKESYLNIRIFSDSMKREAYERQKGVCVARNAVCGNGHFNIEEMEADHITPWKDGGHTDAANCQMICVEDNRRKSDV